MTAELRVFPRQPLSEGRDFAAVAALIDKDSASSAWLPSGLAHFRDFIAGPQITAAEVAELRPIFNELHRELGHLIEWLPLFQHLPLLPCPEDVKVALDVLPRIRKVLGIIALSPHRKRPNVRRQFCAAVVFEAWSIIHGGRPSPIPDRLREACQEYWEVCGGGTGGIEDWRRNVRVAATTDNGLIRKILRAYAAP